MISANMDRARTSGSRARAIRPMGLRIRSRSSCAMPSARSTALRSARAFVFTAIDAAWDLAVTGEPLTVEIRRDLRLAAVNATFQSVKAVDLMYEAGGGSSIHASSPL